MTTSARNSAPIASTLNNSIAGIGSAIQLDDEVNDDENGVNQHARDHALDNRAGCDVRNVFKPHRMRQALVASDDRDEDAERERLDRKQKKILPTQRRGELSKI